MSLKPGVYNSDEGLGGRRGSVELFGGVPGSFPRGRRVNLCLTSLSSLACFPLILRQLATQITSTLQADTSWVRESTMIFPSEPRGVDGPG